MHASQDGDNDVQAELAVELLQENSTITALDFGFANANQVKSYPDPLSMCPTTCVSRASQWFLNPMGQSVLP